MAFQPFGYHFEVKSELTPSELKAAIRDRKKSWFDPKNGVRGWIVGPFICLWSSAFDQHGPMLMGRISPDDHGSKVSGRAGSDLNGVALLGFLVPLFAVALYAMYVDQGYAAKQIAVSGGFFAAITLLVLWSKHAFRREAEPLIRFLNDVARKSGRPSRAKLTASTTSELFKLNVGGDNHVGPITSQVIQDALLNVGAGDFVILSSGEEAYIQTLSRDGDGFILEKREGNAHRHFQANRKNGLSTPTGDPQIFTFDEIREAFMAYVSKSPMPTYLSWVPLRLPS